MSTELRMDIADAVARITLTRGHKRNALTSAMYAELAECFEEVARRPELRVVVLTGSDGSFTAGNDLADMKENPPQGPDAAPERFLRALVAAPQVLVAAVDGPAIGVGTTLLLHADLVYATTRSYFRLPFVNLGLVPEAASTVLLPALVGHPVAAELLLLGRRFSAQEAWAWRLVNEVLPGVDELAERVSQTCDALSAQPAQALLHTRRLLRQHRTTLVRQRLGEDGEVMRQLMGALQ